VLRYAVGARTGHNDVVATATATQRAFRHIGKEYGTVEGGTVTQPAPRPGYDQPGPGSPLPAPGYGYGQPYAQPGTTPPGYQPGYQPAPTGWQPQPGRPGGGFPPGGGSWGGGGGGGGWGSGATPVTERFSAARTYDKLLTLVVIAVVAGAVGWIFVPAGAAFACMLVAFALAMTSWFRPRWAKVTAPAYAVFEGLALGSVSNVYSSLGHGIIPVAVAFTGAVFLGCLVLYRTGLVRVTPKMMAIAGLGAFGIVIVSLLSLVGLAIPGTNDVSSPIALIFGVVLLGVAVLNLFTDFAYVTQAEQMGLPAEAEWASAFAMMTALVLVYIAMLRIAAFAFGGGRRS
jgi:uncharacterized YccA/Bax inhibitor family protein